MEIALQATLNGLRVTVETADGRLNPYALRAARKYINCLIEQADEDTFGRYGDATIEALTGCLDAPLN